MENLIRYLHLDRASDRALEWLTGLAFAGSALGAGVIAVIPDRPDVWIIYLSIAALTSVYVLIARAKDLGKTYRFTEASAEETAFYVDWYGRRGRHTVFTNDFNWMTRAGDQILDAILANPRDFKVYVREPDADQRNIAERLIRAGVTCHVVPSSIQIRVRFSLWQDGDHPWLIVRDKDKESGPRDRVFRQTDDDYLIAVLEDFLANV